MFMRGIYERHKVYERRKVYEAYVYERYNVMRGNSMRV